MRCSHDEHFQADGVRGQSARSGLVCDVVVCLFGDVCVMETEEKEQRSDCPTHCNWVVWVASPTLFTSLMVHCLHEKHGRSFPDSS